MMDAMLRSIGLPELLIIFIAFCLVGLVPAIGFCQISKRLGWSPWLGLVTLIPLGTVFWSFFVGFSRWPERHNTES
jgi:hypothetical protein